MTDAVAPTPVPGEPAGATDPEATLGWIGHKVIADIPGTLKPGAYVARAYHHQQEHGTPPQWARKLDSGRWLFDERYVREDAALNLATVGVSEAARLLGVTRRAVQTWVDEGRLPTSLDHREKGAIRRIARAEFMQQLPELKQRLRDGHRTRSDTASTQEEQRLFAEYERQRRELEAARQQLANDRQLAERRLQAVARAEQRARAREARLRDGYQSRIEQAHQTTREMDRLRASAQREAQRTARREQNAEVRASHLLEQMKAQLEDWRQRSAALINRQLLDAREAWQRPAVAPPPPDQQAAARRSAEAVAAQLHRAQDTAQEQQRCRELATALAESLKREIANGVLDRYDAAIRFHQLTEQKRIPEAIRIEVMRLYFSGH